MLFLIARGQNPNTAQQMYGDFGHTTLNNPHNGSNLQMSSVNDGSFWQKKLSLAAKRGCP
jgi:hypothetical protein